MSFTTIGLIALALALLCGAISALAASRAGRDPFMWMVIGCVLGPIGPLLLLARHLAEPDMPPPKAAPPRPPDERGLRVLCAVDGSGSSEQAVRHLAERLSGRIGSVTLLTVLPAELEGADQEGALRKKHLEEAVNQGFGSAREVLGAAGIPAATLTAFGDPASQILRAADELGADLIVVGRRGRGAIAKALLGSVSESVVRSSTRPVLLSG